MMDLYFHRCTVAGNLGRGPWGLGQIILMGGGGFVGLSENLFSCFVAFLYDNFKDLTPCPPPGPPLDVCIYVYFLVRKIPILMSDDI